MVIVSTPNRTKFKESIESIEQLHLQNMCDQLYERNDETIFARHFNVINWHARRRTLWEIERRKST